MLKEKRGSRKRSRVISQVTGRKNSRFGLKYVMVIIILLIIVASVFYVYQSWDVISCALSQVLVWAIELAVMLLLLWYIVFGVGRKR